MFCRKCGAQIDAGTRFCGSCGEATNEQVTAPANQFTTSSPSDNEQSAPKANHKRIGMIACVAVLLVVIIGAIALFSSGGNQDRALVGTWESTDVWVENQIEFHRNGSGVEIWLTWGDEHEFSWRIDRDGRLWRQYDEGGDEWWVYYEIVGDILRMTTEWNDIWEYRKVN